MQYLEFHVSPFMEMDYRYAFQFSLPKETVSVRASMHKIPTNEIWFTARFDLQRMDFSPWNMLYVLVYYPLHTRLIQVWIHWEAVLLFLKGVPTFEHPQGADVDFGLGITGKRLGWVLYILTWPATAVYSLLILSRSHSKQD